MEHHCHAMGCSASVAPHLLMCPMHWRLVPKKVQQVVWREYRPGQEKDKNPSKRYLVVQAVAVTFVARTEGLLGKAESAAFVVERVKRIGIDPDEGFDLIAEMQGEG